MSTKLVIIGAGMAAAYLLQALGDRLSGMNVTVIGEEPDACYNRVLLSSLLAGDNEESDLGMLESLSVTATARFLRATRVVSVDTKRRLVVTDKHGALSYDRLVFATGANVVSPPLTTGDITGIETLRTLDDARRLKAIAVNAGPAVVVGGGLLGLEAAHGLNTLGFSTTVVHRQPYLMNRQLDEEGARLLQTKLESRGIRLCLCDSVAGLNAREGRLKTLALRSGKTLPCTLLLFATGIVPNVQLAEAGGIAVDRGIRVDARMRTSEPDIFALGECSQLGSDCFGLVAPIREQARVLAGELGDAPGEGFSSVHYPTQLKISGVDIYSAGEIDAAGEQLVLRDDRAGIYRRLVVRDGRLVSAVLVGDKRGGSWYSDLINSRADITAYRAGLIFGREVSESVQLVALAA